MSRETFFTSKHIEMAYGCSRGSLKKGYKKSERELLETEKNGNERELAEVMKKHGDFEYAMLFQKTPKFKKGKKK